MIGRNIIMLSPAVSDKKYGFKNSFESHSVSSTEEDQKKENDVEMVAVKTEPEDLPEKSSSSTEKNNSNADKKRGGPIGSNKKMKQAAGGKNKRIFKNAKKKKGENSKPKPAERAPKVKKSKTFNGPYIHITGSKENPASISVINVTQKGEEKLSKTQTSTSSAVNRIKNKTVGHLSTFSSKYDAYNRDKTWICVFCQKGSHHGGLGDLYGPYYIKANLEEKSNSGTSASCNKRKKSKTANNKTSKRTKQATGKPTPVNCSQNAEVIEPTEPMKEVWIHEDCAVWCQSITLIGEELRGIEEAVSGVNENKCSRCAFHGATLGCCGRGCKKMYHYTCAKETGCQLDIEKFSLLCLKHQKKS